MRHYNHNFSLYAALKDKNEVTLSFIFKYSAGTQRLYVYSAKRTVRKQTPKCDSLTEIPLLIQPQRMSKHSIQQFGGQPGVKKISRIRKDSGFPDEPSFPDNDESDDVFLRETSLREGSILLEEEEKEKAGEEENQIQLDDHQKCKDSERFRIWDLRTSGPKRIMVEETTDNGRECNFFVEEKGGALPRREAEAFRGYVESQGKSFELETQLSRTDSTPKDPESNTFDSTIPLIVDAEGYQNRDKSRCKKKVVILLATITVVATLSAIVTAVVNDKVVPSNKERNAKFPKCLEACLTFNQSIAETALVLLGGEQDGQIVETVELFSVSQVSSCKLPPLPKKLKWGNAGFVEDSILVCGGETEQEDHNRACWVLEAATGTWRLLQHQLTRY